MIDVVDLVQRLTWSRVELSWVCSDGRKQANNKQTTRAGAPHPPAIGAHCTCLKTQKVLDSVEYLVVGVKQLRPMNFKGSARTVGQPENVHCV